MPLGNSLAHSLAHRLGNSLSGGGAPAAALDVFTTVPRAAYSDWRRLLTTYTGPLIRVRKTTGGDTTTQHDVPYAAATNLLDTADLAAFVGSESWAVVTRYDQATGARNVTQATDANQPSGGVAGVASKIATRHAADFDGTNDALRRADALGLSGATGLTVYAGYAADATGNRDIWSLGGTATNTGIALKLSTATNARGESTSALREFTTPNNTSAPRKLVYLFAAGGTFGDSEMYVDGAACAESAAVNPATTLNMANSAFTHGAYFNGAAALFDGREDEVIVWASKLAGAELTAALAL